MELACENEMSDPRLGLKQRVINASVTPRGSRCYWMAHAEHARVAAVGIISLEAVSTFLPPISNWKSEHCTTHNSFLWSHMPCSYSASGPETREMGERVKTDR